MGYRHRMLLSPRLWAVALTAFHPLFATPQEAAAPDVSLPDVVAPAAAWDTDLRWEATEDQPALFRIDAPGPGVVSFMARSDDGDDLRVVVTDRAGVYRPWGDFDSDPRHVPGGEFGGVAVPAGPSLVVVGSHDGRQSGTLRVGFLATPDLDEPPEPSAPFRDATPLRRGAMVAGRAPARRESRGAPDHRCHRLVHEPTSVLRVRYGVTDGADINVYVYRSQALWWPVTSESGASGEITFYPNPDETYYVLVRGAQNREGSTYRLELEDPSRPVLPVYRAPR